jgi:hypothetical protein
LATDYDLCASLGELEQSTVNFVIELERADLVLQLTVPRACRHCLLSQLDQRVKLG